MQLANGAGDTIKGFFEECNLFIMYAVVIILVSIIIQCNLMIFSLEFIFLITNDPDTISKKLLDVFGGTGVTSLYSAYGIHIWHGHEYLWLKKRVFCVINKCVDCG